MELVLRTTSQHAGEIKQGDKIFSINTATSSHKVDDQKTDPGRACKGQRQKAGQEREKKAYCSCTKWQMFQQNLMCAQSQQQMEETIRERKEVPVPCFCLPVLEQTRTRWEDDREACLRAVLPQGRNMAKSRRAVCFPSSFLHHPVEMVMSNSTCVLFWQALLRLLGYILSP